MAMGWQWDGNEIAWDGNWMARGWEGDGNGMARGSLFSAGFHCGESKCARALNSARLLPFPCSTAAARCIAAGALSLPLRCSRGAWAIAGSSLGHLLAELFEIGQHDAALKANGLLVGAEPFAAGAVPWGGPRAR